MRTYIANFGTENWAWGNCLQRSSIAVMDDLRVHPYWQRGDREGYISEVQRVLSGKGNRPIIKPVASRWFNLNTILTDTAGDLWIHREKEQLWWTTSLDEAPQSEIVDDPQYLPQLVKIVVYYKRCMQWQDKTKRGGALQWRGIHPKAREFLFTESTFQELSANNALYAQALINGDDLSSWHSRPDWRAREERAGSGAVKIFNRLEITAARMADTAWQTALQSGQLSLTQAKDKDFAFASKRELELYTLELMKAQENLCALTGLEMVLDGQEGDSELRCSLDRIQSNGHYEPNNLQVVCKFANRWKGASDDEGFRRLIEMLRNADLKSPRSSTGASLS